MLDGFALMSKQEHNNLESKSQLYYSEPYRKGVMMKCNNAGGAVYGFGFVGALVYYLQHATTFMVGLLGFLKALVWPALLVYKVLELWKI